VAVPTKCASWATGELVPPGQARMADGWSDYTGFWVNVYDHKEMNACEARGEGGSLRVRASEDNVAFQLKCVAGGQS
jgi:hypothetical protein